jgi:hypothetical protein
MPDAQSVTALLAMGLTLAVRDPAAPRDGWPWQLDGDYWVLRREWSGPRGALVPEAYDPPQMWHPGRSESVRRAAVLALVAFSLLAIGASLLRPRWALVAVAGGSVAACAAGLAWRGRLSPVVEASGAVIITSDALTQRDDWIYRRHLEPTEGAIAAPTADVLLKPALATTRQLERTEIALRIVSESEPARFTYRLEPSWTIAFRTTRVAAGKWPGEPKKPARTPMRELATSYLADGKSIEGELADPLPSETPSSESAQHWNAVFIEQAQRR